MFSIPLLGWVDLANCVVPLGCCLVSPQVSANDIALQSFLNRVYIVLFELFGVNA